MKTILLIICLIISSYSYSQLSKGFTYDEIKSIHFELKRLQKCKKLRYLDEKTLIIDQKLLNNKDSIIYNMNKHIDFQEKIMNLNDNYIQDITEDNTNLHKDIKICKLKTKRRNIVIVILTSVILYDIILKIK